MNAFKHGNADPRAVKVSPIQTNVTVDPFRARRSTVMAETVEAIYAEITREADRHGANYVGSDIWVGTDGTVYA